MELEPTQPTSGGGDDPSGEVEGQPTPAPEEKPDVVSRGSYEKLLKEKKNQGDALKSLKSELDNLKASMRKEEEDKLLGEKNYAALLEKREERIVELERLVEAKENTIKEYDARWDNGSKIDFFLKAIRKSHGEVPKSYWSLIPVDQIVLNPETGVPDEMTVDKAVNTFAEEFPEVIKRGSGPRIPGHPPPNPPKEGNSLIAYADWKKLPLKEKKARAKDIDPKTRPSYQS